MSELPVTSYKLQTRGGYPQSKIGFVTRNLSLVTLLDASPPREFERQATKTDEDGRTDHG
jgi:hypothetical protein